MSTIHALLSWRLFCHGGGQTGRCCLEIQGVFLGLHAYDH